jgi:prephenate dehydratase
MPTSNVIAFQGVPGAYSDMACRIVYPAMTTLPCVSFEDAFAVVREGQARLAMIPVENSVAGRVADIHNLLPEGGLYIVREHFQRVNHQLMAPRGATLQTIRTVRSHIQALSQCRRHIKELGLEPIQHYDTAGAAASLAKSGNIGEAAIASALAAEIYGLDILKRDLEDARHNTTRFMILAREPSYPKPEAGPAITTLVFRVRSVPAALYKALGGFATNGLNLIKLESYMLNGRFSSVQFYVDVEGHPDEIPFRHALDELAHFSSHLRILGVYPANPFRRDESQIGGDD